jgi:hypothetical protein
MSSASSISAAVLPTPEKTICRGSAPAVQNAPEFALGNDVEAGATARQEVQDGEVGIGLDGIADERIEADQFLLELVQAASMRVPRIDPARRAELGGDVGQWNRFSVQDAVSACKSTHRAGSPGVLEFFALPATGVAVAVAGDGCAVAAPEQAVAGTGG